MKKYNVEIVETLSRVVEQEATSYEDAEKIVQDKYDNCEYILDYNDLEDTDFKEYPYPKIKDSFNININFIFDKDNKKLLINNNDEFRCVDNNDLLRAFNMYIEKNIQFEKEKEDVNYALDNNNQNILDIVKKYDDLVLNDKEIINDDDGVRVQYILIDGNRNPQEVICFGYSDIYDINPKTYEKKYIRDYDYNIDSLLFKPLENGLSIGYMTIANHYDVWSEISNNYENFNHKDGLQKYLEYCKENNITDDLINRELNVNVSDIYKICNKEREER